MAIIEKCPKCGIKLIFNGEGWGFCDECGVEIEEDKNAIRVPEVRGKEDSSEEVAP